MSSNRTSGRKLRSAAWFGRHDKYGFIARGWMRNQGIEIKTLTELASDPECYRKLYELDNEVARDIPTLDESTAANYEFYVETFIDNPQLKHDAHFIALHNREYVGTTSLWESEGDTDLTNSLTGVKRSYRHRGIALALKLRSIAYARAQGCGHIKTWNDSPNTAMIAITYGPRDSWNRLKRRSSHVSRY